jgi:cation-transporting ATPase E
MIPSGMFLLTSMALAVGVIRLARHNMLVQDLYSLEMLARIDVLCLDKTGTITDGRMKVNDCILLANPQNYTISEIMGSMLAELKDNNQTSTALLNHFGSSKVLSAVKTIPFSSKRKFSAVTFKDAGTFAFGAPEFVLKEVPEKIQNLIRQYASMGLRVLVLAYSKTAITGDTLPVMKPMAIITITDCIRENAAATIDWFKANDVDLKVISGDNPLTVSEISRRVGIPNAEKYISLEGMSEHDVIEVAEKYTVFGRVSPEQKAILVKQLKIAGHKVAMTGDGVNDILAMKEADCAVALAAGSDATRNIAHLVLMDNNFNSMPKVVHEGRRVINNIQSSASLYLMKTLFTMLLAVITFLIPFQSYPFETNNMLILEIFIIGVPSFFLSLQKNDKRVEGNFINYVISKAFPSALLMVFSCVIIIFAKALLTGVNQALSPEIYTTMMVVSITFAGVIMLYRTCQPFNLFRGVLFTLCLIAILICVFLSLILGGEIFGLTKMWPLSQYWHHLLIIATTISLIVPVSSNLDKLGSMMRTNKRNKKDNK